MADWVNERTFAKLGVPHSIHVYRATLNPAELAVTLSPGKYPELYEYFMSGGQLLHMPNSEGQVELFTVFDDISKKDLGALLRAGVGVHLDDSTANRFVPTLVVYDNEDNPLQLPFIFDLTDFDHRYEAAAFCEQPKIYLYVLARHEDILVQLSTLPLEWPEDARELFRAALLEAYRPEHTQDGSPRVVDGRFLARDLTDDDILADGWSYQYESRELDALWGDEVPHEMERVLRSALEVLAGVKNKGLRRGPFVVWAAVKHGLLNRSNQPVDGMVYFVSPYYTERASGKGLDVEPCYERLSSVPGFIRSEGGSPVWEGAVPVLRYEDGQIQQMVVDKAFLKRAAAIHDEMSRVYGVLAGEEGIVTSGTPNRYRGLLEHLSKNRKDSKA